MPNRIIKETIRTSKKINSLTDFEFRFWAYLITYVDDYGRGSADPELINSFVFPRMKHLSDETVSETLQKLDQCGCIKLYCSDGEPYFFFPKWEDHQRIRNKKSRFPDPTPHECAEELTTCRNLPQSAAKSARARVESNPIQSNPNTKTNTRARVREQVVVVENFGRAIDDYMNRINPEASPLSMQKLKAFEEDLGSDVCIRAFDIALDEKKTNWSYINGILQNWKDRGVRCVADLEDLEAKRQEATKPKRRTKKRYKTVQDEDGNWIDVEVDGEDE